MWEPLQDPMWIPVRIYYHVVRMKTDEGFHIVFDFVSDIEDYDFSKLSYVYRVPLLLTEQRRG